MARCTLCYIKLTSIVTRIFPISVDDFLRTISPAFNRKYLKEFEASCYHFDHIIGNLTPASSTSSSTSRRHPASNLSDIFICCLDFDSWIADICQAIALYCFKTISPGRKHTHKAIPQCDGPSDMEPLFQAGVVDDGGPFKQVTLVGPNLFEAWNRLSFTRNLENMCHQSSTWAPSQPGCLYVYHGTAAHIENPNFISALANRPFNGLIGKSQRNQITLALGPGVGNIPVVWTAFSPLRAFLWAVFRADVIRNIPGYMTQSKLNQPWHYGNKSYEGVLVLQFSPSQPSPPGCSSYTIPIGEEEQWTDIAASSNNIVASTEPTKSLWARFATIHKQAKGSEWPDLVHGFELPVSRRSLQHFTKQLWRTVWHGQGIQSLNSCHTQSLAIHYILKPDSPPPPLNDQESSTKSKGPCPGKMDTLKRRLSHIFKRN
jgi:hypothetical protein